MHGDFSVLGKWGSEDEGFRRALLFFQKSVLTIKGLFCCWDAYEIVQERG